MELYKELVGVDPKTEGRAGFWYRAIGVAAASLFCGFFGSIFGAGAGVYYGLVGYRTESSALHVAVIGGGAGAVIGLGIGIAKKIYDYRKKSPEISSPSGENHPPS